MRRSSIIFLLSILLGLLFPEFASNFSPFTNVFLVALMFFSLKNVKFHKFSAKHFRNVQWLFVVSLFSGLVFIFVSSFLISDSDIISGIILFGLMPPAIGVIGLSYILKGDVEEALIGETLSYFAYLIITPLLALFFLGAQISFISILSIFLTLIILPLMLAFITRHVDTSRYNRVGIEFCFALIFFTVIGKNVDSLIREPLLFAGLAFLIVLFRFAFTSLFHFSSRKLGFSVNEEKAFVLFSTLKNSGLASVIAINLFPPRTLMVLAAEMLIFPLFIIFLENHYLRKK